VDGLLLARVDARRTAAEVCTGGPYDEIEALQALQQLADKGVLEVVPDEPEVRSPSMSFFAVDLDSPPAEVHSMVPFPTDMADADAPSQSGDYFLYMQVDGHTPVEHLAAVWSRPVGETLGALIELVHRGLIGFPDDFNSAFFVSDDPPDDTTGELDPAVEGVLDALAADDFLYAALSSLTPAIDSDADISRISLTRTEGYPLGLVDGRHTIEEVCELSARTRAETAAFLLYLFHVGLIKLLPAESVAAPAAEPAKTITGPVEASPDLLAELADYVSGPVEAPEEPLEEPQEAISYEVLDDAEVLDAAGGEGGEADGFMELEWQDDDAESEHAPPLITDSQPILTPPPGLTELDSQPILTPPPDLSDSDSQPIVAPPTQPRPEQFTPAESKPIATPAPVGDLDSGPITGPIPPPEDAYVLPPAVARGSTETAVAAALRERGASGWTGRIEVVESGTRWTLWLEGGKLAYTLCDSPQDDLAFHLFQSGTIGPDDYGAIEAERRMSGKDVAAIMRDKQLLPLDVLATQAAGFDAALARAAIESPDAEIEVQQEEPVPAGFVRRPQPLEAVIASAVVEQRTQTFTDPYVDLPSYSFRALLEDHVGYYLIVDGSPPPSLDEPQLELFEYMAAAPRRLAEVRANSPLSRTKTRRLLYALYCEGWFVFDLAPGLRLHAEYDVEDLEDELERQVEADHFRRLGLHFGATGEEVEAAYTRLATHFDSAQMAGESGAAAHLVREIRERVDEAFARLADEGTRRAYRADRLGMARVSFHAEVERRRGLRFLSEQQPERALAAFGRAYDLRPDEPVHLACRALAEAELYRDDLARFQRSRMALERAAALAPDNPEVVAALAAFHRAHGEPEVAEEHARRARQLASTTPGSQPRLRALGL